MVEVEGLADVVAADSSICYIDGDRGILSYRGIDIHELAEKSTFEEVCFLLWEGRLPRKDELSRLRAEIGRERAIPAGNARPPEEVGRARHGHGRAPDGRLGAVGDGPGRAVDAARRQPPQGRAAHGADRHDRRRLPPPRRGEGPGSARPGRGHAEDFLRMLNGESARAAAVRALDVALILHADHELNASTFAARVTAATLSDMHSAITSAIGTLKGPLHGGANEAVLQMLRAIGSLDRVDDDIHARLARKEKIMGFGHRVYTTEDPRATHLRAMSEEVARASGDTTLYDMSRRIEQIVTRRS